MITKLDTFIANIGFIKNSPPSPLFWVALLRIMLGILFLTTWGSNLDKGFYTADGLEDFFTNVFPQSNNELTWYASFIEDVILPIRSVFAPFQLVTEFLLAIALLTGFWTRAFSLAGAFFIINTFLATWGVDWAWSYLTILSIFGVLFFTKAGRTLGVDALLLKRYGESKLPLW